MCMLKYAYHIKSLIYINVDANIMLMIKLGQYLGVERQKIVSVFKFVGGWGKDYPHLVFGGPKGLFLKRAKACDLNR